MHRVILLPPCLLHGIKYAFFCKILAKKWSWIGAEKGLVV